MQRHVAIGHERSPAALARTLVRSLVMNGGGLQMRIQILLADEEPFAILAVVVTLAVMLPQDVVGIEELRCLREQVKG